MTEIESLIPNTDEDSLKRLCYLKGYKSAENGVIEPELFEKNQKVDYNEFVEEFLAGYYDCKEEMRNGLPELPF